MKVCYQDPCHLAHAQRIKEAPRQLLKALPGVEVVEMAHADWCCGSAGVYNMTHPEMADTLLKQKMEDIASTGAQVVATANPGCLIQLQAGAAKYAPRLKVVHIMDLLNELQG